MYLYKGKLYAETKHQIWELMRLIEADIRRDGHATIGEKWGRLHAAKAAWIATLPRDHASGGSVHITQKKAVVPTIPAKAAKVPEREKEATGVSTRERIILEAMELDRARIARRKKSRLENPIE